MLSFVCVLQKPCVRNLIPNVVRGISKTWIGHEDSILINKLMPLTEGLRLWVWSLAFTTLWCRKKALNRCSPFVLEFLDSITVKILTWSVVFCFSSINGLSPTETNGRMWKLYSFCYFCSLGHCCNYLFPLPLLWYSYRHKSNWKKDFKKNK
jgi:hypothetical protein